VSGGLDCEKGQNGAVQADVLVHHVDRWSNTAAREIGLGDVYTGEEFRKNEVT
jgi:hypothetical protein